MSHVRGYMEANRGGTELAANPKFLESRPAPGRGSDRQTHPCSTRVRSSSRLRHTPCTCMLAVRKHTSRKKARMQHGLTFARRSLTGAPRAHLRVLKTSLGLHRWNVLVLGVAHTSHYNDVTWFHWTYSFRCLLRSELQHHTAQAQDKRQLLSRPKHTARACKTGTTYS